MGMKNRFQEAIQNVQRQRHLARRSVAMVLVLAMLTAMSVSWRLHQDGIALAADDTRYYCGKEEHKHTDDCYIEGTEPICGYEEGEIVEETMDSADDAGDGDSSAADRDEAGSEPESEPATQEEPEPEVVLHHHTADCYEEEEVLTCGIEGDHVHQDYCYDQETGELLCTEHEHTDDCYTLEKVLVCGQEEGEPEETDDGIALYDRDENSAEESDSAEEPETVADPEPEQEATKPETDDEIDTGYTVHHHTAECYGKVLICGKEEHEHTADCLVNPNAEIDAEYDAKTPERTSVDWAQDMVLVARSQLGYTESKADVDEDGNGYTMYADQYYKDKPMVYADWDSTFVAYCLYHAGVPQDIIPQYASISALRGELARMNSEYYTDDPQEFASILPGDIVMYKNAEGRETIGVVSDAAVDEETDLTTALTVISGDVATGCESDGETTIDQVAEVSVALNDVTSFVSVNAAEGYGISDLMDGEQGTESLDVVATGTPVDLATLHPTITALRKTGNGNDDYSEIPDDYVFTEGDSVKIEGSFKIRESDFTSAEDNTVTWDIGMNLPRAVADQPITVPVKNEYGEVIGTTEIGKYSVGTDGKVSFVFDRAKIKAAGSYDVNFWLTATAELRTEEDKGTVVFPGSTTSITIKKKSDISIKKSSEDKETFRYDENGNPYIEFEIKVSTKNGTHGTVDIKDALNQQNNIKGGYDKTSFVLEKYDSNGELLSTTSLTSNEKLTIADSPESFEIDGLEKLNAGQYYILKYKYKVDKDKCTDKKLSGYFENGANAKYDGGDWTDPYLWSTTYKNRLQKSGTYDKITNKIKWEVLVRNLKDGADLEDYTVEDSLGTTGAKIDDPVLIYAGNDESSLNLQESSTVDFKKNSAGENVGFTYTFKRGSTQKYYKFVYYTNAVDGVAQVDNKATISKGNDSESVDVPTKTDKLDQYVGKAAAGSLETAKGNKNLMKAPRWYFTVALPTGSTAKSIEAYDWFIPATNGTQTADHYAFYEELKEQLNKCIRIYTTTTGYDEKDVTWAANNGIQITYEMYQNYTKTAEGIEPGQHATQAGDKVRAFKIKIDFNDSKAGNVWKLNVGVAGYTGYSSYIDTTSVNLKDGKNWTIENSIKALGEKKSAYYTYQKTPGKNSLEKMVSNQANGEGWHFCKPDEAESFDYAKASTIWYKLWLEVDSKQDTVKIKDTLPKGMILDSTQSPYAFYASEGGKQDSVYNKDDCKYPANDFSVSISTNVNDQQEITFTLKNINDSTETDLGEWQKDADHDVNDKVCFRLTGTLPENYATYTTYEYIFHDTMSKGLTFDPASVEIYHGDEKTGTKIDANYTVSTQSGTKGETEITIQFANLKTAVNATSDDKITVVYEATLNEQSVIGSAGNPNKVYLEFSNNPNGNGTGKTPEDTVTVFTYKVAANKVDGKGKELAGAGFKLSKFDKDKGWELVGYQNVKLGDKGNPVVTDGHYEVANATDTSFAWNRIDDGKYKLEEVVTPAGYNTIDPVEFDVVAGHANLTLSSLSGTKTTGTVGEYTFTSNNAEGSLTTDIVNQSGTVLPSTGGMGTTVFYVVGGGLMAVAVVLLVTKKRMENKR